MIAVNVYLSYDGNCKEAFNIYKSIFVAEFAFMGRYKDMPPQEGCDPISEEDAEKIMHVSLPVRKETVLMGSDTGGQWVEDFKPGNNFAVSISAGSREEADRLFNGLSEGGTVTMPMAGTFWGDYFGMFTDKFGISWMVSFAENPQK